jgi:hypothetical protein
VQVRDVLEHSDEEDLELAAEELIPDGLAAEALPSESVLGIWSTASTLGSVGGCWGTAGTLSSG